MSVVANNIIEAGRRWLQFLRRHLYVSLCFMAVSGWVFAGAMWVSRTAPSEIKSQVLYQQEDNSVIPPNPGLKEINPAASDLQESNPPVSRPISAIPIPEARGATSTRKAGIPVIKVYGPDLLTDLTRQAIQEKRPDVAIETYYEPLENKVWIEGTTGAGYIPLSPERVDRMLAARARGGSVYSALCSQQKGVIQKTLGLERISHRVVRREVRTVIRQQYVQPICPYPTTICVPSVNVGFAIGGYYPVYGYRAYGMWGDRHYHDYHGPVGYLSFNRSHTGHHVSAASHRGHK